MKVFGFEIPDQTVSDVIKSITGTSFNAVTIKNLLEEKDVPRDDGLNYISINAASRIITLLKKKGCVKNVYGGGGKTLWQWNYKNKQPIKYE